MMKYEGKLYGRVGSKYVLLKQTSKDVDELEKDKKRLDWLADVNNTIGTVMLPKEAILYNTDSMRAAIDQAMEMWK